MSRHYTLSLPDGTRVAQLLVADERDGDPLPGAMVLVEGCEPDALTEQQAAGTITLWRSRVERQGWVLTESDGGEHG